jgi:DNA end-binding protein Ku
MAGHPLWRGHLRFALVSCPVALYTARRESGTVRFHLINPETRRPVRLQPVDAETGQPVPRRSLLKGYEFRKGQYLLLSDEDLKSAEIDSSWTLNVEKFVSTNSIEPLYFESSYYLVPDGDSGQDVYVVLREALRRAGRMALSRLVIARRERALAILPMQRGLVAHTLHEQRDIVDPSRLFSQIPDIRPAEELIELAIQLIDRQTGKFDPADMEDRYETRLRVLIEAKLHSERLQREAPTKAPGGQVIDLMAALKKSLGAADSSQASRRRATARPSTPAAAIRSRRRASSESHTGSAR